MPNDTVNKETTFVFVTPRRWSKKDEWAEVKRKEDFWQDVRAYDADDLATWLEFAPSVHIWISILLGKHPETAIDLENFWKEWSEVTNPPLSPDLVIAERNDAVDKIHNWLNQPASLLALKAESKSEAIAFFAATVSKLQTERKEKVFSICLVTEDISAWRQLSVSTNPLILISKFAKNDATMGAIQNGHHVLIPIDKSDATLTSTVQIPRLRRENAKQALINMGVSQDFASSLATLARRSFLAFRRKIAINPEIHTPIWSKPSEARSLLAILLVGGFNDAYEKDREAVAKIAQTSYEVVNDSFIRWANEPDPPLRRVGNTWLISSKEDSWSLLARYLTRQDLDTFEKVALDVLGEIDTQYKLPPDERWKVGIFDKTIPYSGLFREGIVETLALMASRSDSTNWADALSGEERANRIIYQLLRRANENWMLWASIADLQPLLAEAAPEAFLNSVEIGLSGEDPVLLNIFSEGENSWTSSSPHTGLLWALETLAWNPNYLGHAAMLLAKLTRLDPGGNLGNRPSKSLREIFLCWHPQTIANLDERLQVIDTIRKYEPEVAWYLLNALLPELHSVSLPTSSPRWREWSSEKPIVTIAEVWRAASEIASRLIFDAGMNGKRWKSIISQISNLPPDQQTIVLEKLLTLNIDKLVIEDRLQIWKALRDVISKHREYPTSDWAMPTDLSDKLEKIYHRFTPKDITDQYAWLFSQKRTLMRPVPYLKNNDSPHHWELNKNLLGELRWEAVNKLFAEEGLKTLIKTAAKAERPEELGVSFGRSELLSGLEELYFFKENLASSENSTAAFVRGYIFSKFQTKGWKWTNEILSFENKREWSFVQYSEFLACLPFNKQTWEIVDSLGEETKKIYWTKVFGYPESADAERAAREFLQYGRPQVAIEFLYILCEQSKLVVPPSLVVEILKKLSSISSETGLNWSSLGYSINLLFDLLDKSGEIEESIIASLEWVYMPILENYGRGPKLLHLELSRNPEFFVDVVSYIYRAEDEEKEDLSENNQTQTDLADKLIDSWRDCPGKNNEDGSFDSEFFRNWVNLAREKFSKKNRVKIGDILLGHMLAFAPFGGDSAFPHEAVRDLIEETANSDIERGMEIQIFNNRGIFMKSIAEGGGQEKSIAERYLGYAKALSTQYPRTAAMLRRIGDNYLSQARSEDLTAELEQDLWR